MLLNTVASYTRVHRGVQKLHPLLRAPRAAGARNICVGFADVTRASGENLAHVTQNSRTMCVMSPAYIMQILRAPAARGARNKGCYFWTPL
jgi:hypothetical protein